MFRYAKEFLVQWGQQERCKPLIIRGARQVGKSTLVRRYCEQQGLVLCEVNLERHLKLEQVFKSLDTKKILDELTVLSGTSPLHENHLLFLDEIQATPAALAALRYLYEDYPNLRVIAAGSLLDFALKDQRFSMPVGRIDYYHLGPMSFQEFLLAVDDAPLVERLEQVNLEHLELSPSAHEKLLQRHREYLLVGGMPEAVYAYRQKQSFDDVLRVHESILSTLKDDFNKYTQTSKELTRLQHLLHYIPGHVGEKVKYSNIASDEKSRDVRHAIELLSLARICYLVKHSDCSGLPLQANVHDKVFKTLMVDIGLMNRLLGLDWTAVREKNAQTLINAGGLAEQFVGQHLLDRAKGLQEPSLHYWLREGKSSNAEVDYVISKADWIVPIEVKAGESGSLRSLHQFVLAKAPNLCVRFDANLPSLAGFQHKIKTQRGVGEIHYRLLSLPVYMVEQLERLLDEARASAS